VSEDTKYLLHFDEGKQGTWTDSDGSKWQVFYCSWRPGRVAGYLAKRHTPEICLPATGANLLVGPSLSMMRANNLDLPIRSYVFGTERGPIYVFHCRWEAGAPKSAYVEAESARFNLIRGVWAGRGDKGQKVLEIAIYGVGSAEQARAAVARELDKLVRIEKE
jgi:hypothetical protein